MEERVRDDFRGNAGRPVEMSREAETHGIADLSSKHGLRVVIEGSIIRLGESSALWGKRKKRRGKRTLVRDGSQR